MRNGHQATCGARLLAERIVRATNRKPDMKDEAEAAPVRYADIPRPRPGEMTEVAPGVFWLRFPLPFRLNHVNVWVIEDEGDCVTAVDTGICNDATKALWDQVLAGPLAGKRISRLVATHYHPDHIGLCGWLAERTGAVFAAGLADWLYARVLARPQSVEATAATQAFYSRAGAADDLIDYVMGQGGAYRSLVGPAPPTLQRLRAGDELSIGGRRWRMLHTTGHTPEPVSLYCPDNNVLISGDQVLPRISPNISVTPSEPEADPLSDFLATFDGLRRLPEDVLVLPSHDSPFYGLHGRLAALETHHQERLNEIAALCDTPRTAREIAEDAFAVGLDTHQQMFALGEVLAHLNHLQRSGRIQRADHADGACRYFAAPRQID